jgi:predicted negative regulator of RcsB-dependent stress response
MHRIAMEFVARQWWRHAQVWLIAILLIAGGSVLGFQAYDEAMGQRDLRLNALADKAGKAAEKVEAAASTATQAAGVASKAADKVNEAVDRANP